MNTNRPKSPQSAFTCPGECLRRRETSGVYYAWFKHRGKQIHRSLKTHNKPPAAWLDSIRPRFKPKTFANQAHCVVVLNPCFRRLTLAGITAARCEA